MPPNDGRRRLRKFGTAGSGMSYVYIDSNAALAAEVRRWRQCAIVCVDTEFIRTRTFYPIPALYQVAVGGDVFLIDPLTIDQWGPFAELLADPAVSVIMHSCSEDLEVFSRHLSISPESIFDTQIAHAFVSDRFSVSYSALVSKYLDVELGKHETRSDWLRRPLSADQLSYAAADVAYLEPLYTLLRDRLQELGRWSWFVSECALMTAPKVLAADDYYRGIRKAAHLDRRQLARLQKLSVWRERRVREQDVPRARFLADEILVEIARAVELTADELQQLLRRAAADRKAARRPAALADEILALVQEADRLAEDALPERLDQPLSRADNAVITAMRDVAVARAEELEFAPELLARRKELEHCMRHYLVTGQLSDAYTGWRYAQVGAAFERLLAAHTAESASGSPDNATAGQSERQGRS